MNVECPWHGSRKWSPSVSMRSSSTVPMHGPLAAADRHGDGAYPVSKTRTRHGISTVGGAGSDAGAATGCAVVREGPVR